MAYSCPGCGAQLKGPASVAAHAQWNPQCTKEMRFWGRTDKFSSPRGCWLYKGRLDALGYGRVDKAGPLVFAHRCAWIWAHGPIPPGMDIMHHCDTRNCVNVAHMELCTAKENSVDMWKKGRSGQPNVLPPEVVKAIRGAPPEVSHAELSKIHGAGEGVICQIRLGKKYWWVE